MIENDAQLASFLPKLKRAPWIALDTEADSLHAYPERLCLIQVSIPDIDELIDPLADLDLTPLFDTLRPRELIFHGADFDLRLLRKAAGFVPTQIFDTALAARLLGETKFGLQALVSTHLGVHLRKGQQKANWARRPLTRKLIDYAKGDTQYLSPLADRMGTLLEQQNRRSWHRESCDRLIHDCAQPPVIDEERVWRVRGSDRLDRRGLALLRELWHWREKQALAANRPPYFIVSHENLVALAEAAAAPEPPAELPLPPRLSRHRVRTLRQALSRALALPSKRWPRPVRGGRRAPRPRKKADASALKQRRDDRARELGIDPTLIANRNTLELLAFDWESNAGDLMSWQRELLRPDGTET